MSADEFKALPNWEKVRAISGIMPLSGDDKRDLNQMISRLTLICLISRVEAGDADVDFLNEQIDRSFGVKKS